jgi:hypothetical protein
VAAVTTAKVVASLPRATIAPEIKSATALANNSAETRGDFIDQVQLDVNTDVPS